MTKLQDLRVAKGLSQSQLADVAGLSVRTLQEYEHGRRDINGAKLSSLISLSTALNCNVTDILTDENLIGLIKENHLKLK